MSSQSALAKLRRVPGNLHEIVKQLMLDNQLGIDNSGRQVYIVWRLPEARTHATMDVVWETGKEASTLAERREHPIKSNPVHVACMARTGLHLRPPFPVL